MSQDGPVKISKRLILINSGSSVVQRIISLTVLLWLQQWLWGKVHEDEYAVYTLLVPLMVFVPLLTGILGGALARFVTVEYARGNLRGVTQVTSTMLPLCVAGGVLLLVVGLPAAWFIDDLINVVEDPTNPAADRLRREARIMLALMVVMAAVRTALMPYRLGLNVTQKFVLMNLIAVGSELVRIGVLMVLLFGVDTRVLWVIVAGVPATALDLILSNVWSRRLVPALRFERAAFRRDLFRPILTYGWWTLLIRLAVLLRESYSQILLKLVAGSTAVGTFGLASRFDNQIRRNALIMTPSMQPALTAMHATGQHDRLRRAFFRFGRYLIWVFLLISAPFIAFCDTIWLLYLGTEGLEKAHDVSAVMIVLLARVVFSFLQAPIATISFATGHSRPLGLAVAATELVAAIAVTYAVLVADGGALGMAIAITATSIIAQPTVFWPLGLRMTGARMPEFARHVLVPGFAPLLLAAPVWWVLSTTLSPRLVPTLFGIAAGAVVFAAAVVYLLPANERQQLLGVFRRRRPADAR